jgi:hypothetical protein
MAIDEEMLGTLVHQELDSSDTWMDADLADQQGSNLEYYHAQPFGNEKAGFSQVVTRDVMETVEGIMPELMKIFSSGDNVVEFEPVGPEDVEQAQQASDYINHIFERRVDGFKILYNWFKDSLIMKNSVIKTGWTEEDKVEIHHFSDLTQEGIDALEEEESVTEIEAEETDEGLFDVKVTRTMKKGQPFIEHIPSEQFRIKARSRSIAEASFVAHVNDDLTAGDLIEMGFDEDIVFDAASVDRVEDTTVPNARFSDVDEEEMSLSHDMKVELIEAYIKVYDEDDKRNKIMRVFQIGHNVLESEEVESKPFINLSPILMPHKFTGVAYADLVRDIQEIRSSLYRNTLDNIALVNAGRYSAVEGQVNLQDLIDNKIGGIVRQKTPGAVAQLPTPNLSGATFPFLQELEQEKEDRTGVSKMTQGLDSNALTSNTAATAVNQIMTAAQQKILLIARVFAETGVKELFWHLYRLVRTHQTEDDIVRLRGRFVQVRPFDWSDRSDMRVTVGLGNGNKDQQLFHLNNIQQLMQTIGNTQYGYLITAENVHNLAAEMIKNAGYKNTQSFVTDPQQVQPPPPKPSPEMVEAQTNAKEAESKFKLDQARLQDQAKQTALKEQQLQLDMAKFEWQKRIDAAELAVEAEQDRPVGIGK